MFVCVIIILFFIIFFFSNPNVLVSVQAMMRESIAFASHCVAAGVKMTPKIHLMLHLGPKAFEDGSPSQHACWQDETLNKEVAAVAQKAHRSVWMFRVLTTFSFLTGAANATGPKRARRK